MKFIMEDKIYNGIRFTHKSTTKISTLLTPSHTPIQEWLLCVDGSLSRIYTWLVTEVTLKSISDTKKSEGETKKDFNLDREG